MKQKYGKAADVYALGAITFTLLTKSVPINLKYKKRYPVLPPLIDDRFYDIVRKMLAEKEHRIDLDGIEKWVRSRRK